MDFAKCYLNLDGRIVANKVESLTDRFLTFISFGVPAYQMDIVKYDIYRGPNIGVYTSVNDEFVFIPRGFVRSKAETLAGHLGVRHMNVSVGGTRVIGALMVANNHGLLLPQTAYPDEIEALETTGLNVEILDTRYNALGNMMSANDRGAVVSPLIERENLKKIEQALDVEVVQSRIAGYNQAGAMLRVNGTGGIIHPEADDEDVKTFSNVLGARLEPATVNGGVPFVASGTLINNRAVVTGSFTTGPEIMMLTRAFIG